MMLTKNESLNDMTPAQKEAADKDAESKFDNVTPAQKESADKYYTKN